MKKLPVVEDHKPCLTDDTKWLRVNVQEINTLEKLVPLISEFADTNPEIPIAADRTIDSLGLDKLDILMLTMAIEEDFDINISDSDMDECKTVGDIVNLIDKELAKC